MGFGKQLARTAPAVVAGAVIGSLGTKPTSRWYLSLDRPSWEPPPIAFPVVWTSLYALIAGGTARAMAAAPTDDERRAIQRSLQVNMALNAGWCWLFFTAERPRLALAEIAVLEASTLDLLRRLRTVDPTAHRLVAPYAAWNAFAAALNAEIVRRNP